MKLKLIASLLLSLFTASAFAHNYHDDEAPQPPIKQEAPKDAKAPAAKPKHQHTHLPAAGQDKAQSETPAAPVVTEPKKTP